MQLSTFGTKANREHLDGIIITLIEAMSNDKLLPPSLLHYIDIIVGEKRGKKHPAAAIKLKNFLTQIGKRYAC